MKNERTMKNKVYYLVPLTVLCSWVAFTLFIGVACSFGQGGDQPTQAPPPVEMPGFPWPPPKPSAIAIVNFNSLTKSGNAKLTFGDINAKINESLVAGNYTEKSYYGIPGGFALTTRIEQIDENGSPSSSDRWVTEIIPVSLGEFSLQKYLNALFSAPKGRYRIFVFMVTSNTVFSSGTQVKQSDAQDWVIDGANKLPDEVMSRPYTKHHLCTVYVYEFIQSGYNQQAIQNTPSNMTGEEHLQQAGLWDILEK